MAKISFSGCMIKTPIDKLAKDIEYQVEKVTSLFSIQCDKTSDIFQLLQLLEYVCFNRGYAVLQTPSEHMQSIKCT